MAVESLESKLDLSVDLRPFGDLSAIITSCNFWADLSVACEILGVVKIAMDVMQAGDLTLADCFVLFSELGRVLQRNCRRFDADSRTIIFRIYNKIWSDLLNLEDGLVILAYFLNPRYHNQFLKPAIFKDIKIISSKLWYRKGKTKEQLNTLLNEIDRYNQREVGFDLDYHLCSDSPLSWWSKCGYGSEIKELATMLISLSPVSPYFLRSFSVLLPRSGVCKEAGRAFPFTHMENLYELEDQLMYRRGAARRVCVKAAVEKVSLGVDDYKKAPIAVNEACAVVNSVTFDSSMSSGSTGNQGSLDQFCGESLCGLSKVFEEDCPFLQILRGRSPLQSRVHQEPQRHVST
eukprot:TRINITY_DN9642_c0_g1_i1.p1 TRINITY_DN9642_c0_g1~~TRINITY_DN9642_c0_g1_i1.p1  ORF type:complete len:391 (-),score=103.29 TRINITY_DN9642_c0_g1_i1:62-1105(-)